MNGLDPRLAALAAIRTSPRPKPRQPPPPDADAPARTSRPSPRKSSRPAWPAWSPSEGIPSRDHPRRGDRPDQRCEHRGVQARPLARVGGVASVGVTSGPDGEFVFDVGHGSDIDLRDAILALPGFGARRSRPKETTASRSPPATPRRDERVDHREET